MPKAFERAMDAGLIVQVAAEHDMLFCRYWRDLHRFCWNGFKREAGL